jgi:purine-nucleoside phosphorylase
MDLKMKLHETMAFLQKKTPIKPFIGIVLGSGLGDLAESSAGDVVLSYEDIPYFVRSTVPGHPGKLFLGYLYDHPAIVMQGRMHYYEGYSMDEITFPVYLMGAMGVQNVIVTDAAGAINKKYRAGDIVFLTDHINAMGINPLRGPHHNSLGELFPDMSSIYNAQLRKFAKTTATRNRIRSHEGIYIGVQGPSYETPAEIRAFKDMGADVVGMSIVPEAVTASKMGMNVLGMVYVSNLAAGVSKKPLTHQEVINAGKLVRPRIGKIVQGVVSSFKANDNAS